jgi:predicted transcriptional regulator YdeE
MDTYILLQDLKVFGVPVETFPQGIGEAFGAIMQKIPDGKSRSYYGLSNMDVNGKVFYYAAAEEKSPGEAEKYGYERYTIQKGDYLTEAVHDWRTKTSSIKDIFHEMMQDKRADITKPCVEWYKDDNEMICMLKADPAKALLAAIGDAATELQALLAPLDEKKANTIPFKDSWTAAQLATHVTKSNKAMAQAMEMEGKQTGRNPAERAKELKDTFLNFSIKFKSPAFIVPAEDQYKKESVIAALKKSNDQLKENAGRVNTAETINLPAFGEITKLELLYFVLYHTKRHIHQLKNIVKHI